MERNVQTHRLAPAEGRRGGFLMGLCVGAATLAAGMLIGGAGEPTDDGVFGVVTARSMIIVDRHGRPIV
ncbi:MAG: hypothetical protein VYC34_05075, partial [Planctomycetota bacterium]|nr:hypothetical protein [Planctomycetota bacterium]